MLALDFDTIIVIALVVGAVIGVGLLAAQSEVRNRVKAWDQKRKLLRAGQMSQDALEAWIEDGEKLAAECEKQAAADTNAQAEFLATAARIRDDIRAYESVHMAASLQADAKSVPTISELARLRSDGLITPDEFKAFAERFKLSTGKKAQEIIGAIEDLHRQRKAGAMSEGNYHASLWTLMDRLDSDTKAR